MRIVILAVLALLLSAQAQAANLFKCKGADGVVVFQNVQCANAADTQARYRYERLPDDASHVESEARYVQQNQRRYASEANAMAASREGRSPPRINSEQRAAIQAEISRIDSALFANSFAVGRGSKSALRHATELEKQRVDLVAQLNGLPRQLAQIQQSAVSAAHQPVSQRPVTPDQYYGIDGRPSGQFVPIGGNRVKNRRTGEKHNTIEIAPGQFRAIESPAQVNERVRKALEVD
jgi:hypothetical protein